MGLMLAGAVVNAAPPAPANVRSAWVDNSSVLITWDDVPEAESFKIFRFDSANQTWVVAATDVGVPMFREEPGFEPPHEYAVSAVNADGESSASVTTVATTGWSGTMVMFYDPSWYPWLSGRTSVTLQFVVTPVDGTDALLEVGTSPDDLNYLEFRPDYAGMHSFIVTSLTPATQYFFRATFTDTNRLGVSFIQQFYTLPTNIPPTVYDLSASVFEDEYVTIVPQYMDPDLYGPPTIRVVTDPAHGAVFFDGASFYYTPSANFFGTDTFTYAAHDGEDEGAPATVTITVHPVNDLGVVQPFGLDMIIAEDEVATNRVSVSDVEGDLHTLYLTNPPEAGTVEIDGTNFVFHAGANVSGTFSFGLSAADENMMWADGIAWFVVHVLPVNDPPVAQGGSVTISEDTQATITLQASDIETPQLLFEIVEAPQHGVLTGDAPNLVYTPHANYVGNDRFVFRVIDSRNAQSAAEITLTVTPENDAPVANNVTVTTTYNNPVQTKLSGSDLEGAPLTYIVDTLPAHGTLSGTVPNLYFLPTVGWSGTTTFNYHVNDGTADSATATVTITVQPPTAPPTAPSITAQAISSTLVNVSWMDKPNEDGFIIERASGQNWTQVGSVGPGFGPYIQTFSDTTVQPNKTYSYRVRAFNILGSSPYSNVASVKTPR